jgi:hypothetical protein
MIKLTLDQIVNAVLYEGYILYPYRASSKKNRRERFTFGRVYPKDYSESQQSAEPFLNQTECLVRSTGERPVLEVTVRFLHPMWREVGYISSDAPFRVVPELSVAGKLYQTWQEATEREVAVSLGPLKSSPSQRTKAPFSFPALRKLEHISVESSLAGKAIQRRQEAVEGTVEIEAEPLGADVFKITVRVLNRTPLCSAHCNDQDAVIMRTFTSTHTILRASGGQFISMMDTPPHLEELAAKCKNIGTWPVLVEDERPAERGAMLSSPIILDDYPQAAPESAGSFFDGTGIDQMLAVRMLTMTEAEKLEMRQVDECARRTLERTEAMETGNLLRRHGTMRETCFPANNGRELAEIGSSRFQGPGGRPYTVNVAGRPSRLTE